MAAAGYNHGHILECRAMTDAMTPFWLLTHATPTVPLDPSVAGEIYAWARLRPSPMAVIPPLPMVSSVSAESAPAAYAAPTSLLE